MLSVFQNLADQIKENKASVFAIITAREGSVPRGVGTSMLTGEDGIICGTVGGGLVEYKAMEFSQEMIAQKIKYAVKSYNLEIGTNSKNSLDMVCGGSVEIRFVLLNQSDKDIVILAEQIVDALLNHRRDYFLIDEIGQMSFCRENDLDKEIALKIPQGGVVFGDKFIMPIPIKERVVIFGGGHVAKALVPLVASVGFECILFECRADYVDKANYEMADEIILGDYEKIDDYIELNPSDYLVIMTHDHAFDLEIEKQVLCREFTYVGVMGSRRKKATVAAKLRDAGISETVIESVHTPIGLSIGGQMPEEIAVSIVAELIQTRNSSGNK